MTRQAEVRPPAVRISVGDHRRSTNYRNIEMQWQELKDRCSDVARTNETTAQYASFSKEEREKAKDHGGFVGGWMKDGRRKKENMLYRSVGMLDADNIPQGMDFISSVKAVLAGTEYFLYSTHSHTKENQRYRIAILFSREVTCDEYPAIMRMVAKEIGIDCFDDTTYEINRMMYWPTCPADGEFVFSESKDEIVAEIGNGSRAAPTPLDADAWLAKYEDWHDISTWPVSSRVQNKLRNQALSAEKQQDPLTKSGMVGAFNRVYYPISKALEEFLPEVYEPTSSSDRYTYIPGSSVCGVVVYNDKFVYSFHATDPASQKLCNAFDIVRIHKFGSLGDKESYKVMCDFAARQEEVAHQKALEHLEELNEDFGNEYTDTVSSGSSEVPNGMTVSTAVPVNAKQDPTQTQAQNPVSPAKDKLERLLALLPEPIVLSSVLTPPPKPPELIKGLLRKGHKMILSGESKAGKSFMLMELAIDIAEGLPWLGFQCVQGKVFYINLEIDPASCTNRFVDIYKAKGIPYEKQHGDNIVYWNLRGKALPLNELVPGIVEKMRLSVEATGVPFSAVILDPIYKVITGDENNASDMGAFCNQFDKICTATGASAIYCHHHSKGAQGSKKAIDRASGSGVFARDPDAQCDIIRLKKPRICLTGDDDNDESDSESDEEDFDNPKTAWRLEASLREFPPIRPVNFWFDYPLHPNDTKGILDNWAPEGSAQANLGLSTGKSTLQVHRAYVDKAYNALKANPPIRLAAMAAEVNISVNTMRNYLKELSDEYCVANGIVMERPVLDTHSQVSSPDQTT